MNLRGLVHFLWREAELARWQPAFDGKRTWAVVRSHLLAAASNKVLKGRSLADAIYIPEAFTVAASEAIRARRERRFAQGFRRDEHGQSKMILIGEVKEIVPARFHFHAVIKHVPDAPFLLTTDLHRRMTRHFANELALWTGSPQGHLIIAATFALADWDQPMIDELCLVPTSAQWLPVDDGFEKQLIDRLVTERRVFDKSLGFNARLASNSISAVLLDAPTRPSPWRWIAAVRATAIPRHVPWPPVGDGRFTRQTFRPFLLRSITHWRLRPVRAISPGVECPLDMPSTAYFRPLVEPFIIKI